MKHKILWLQYYVKNYIKRYLEFRLGQLKTFLKIEKQYNKLNLKKTRRIAGKKQKSLAYTNCLIAEKIKEGTPFWAGRFGGTEEKLMASILNQKYLKNDLEVEQCLTNLCVLSGFFPNDIDLGKQFVELMLKCSQNIDLLGTWHSLFMEDYIIKNYCKNSKITRMTFLEPWMPLFERSGKIEPWSQALVHKKVLVIHPFADTIKNQYYNKRGNIFAKVHGKYEILPEFELYTLKAVQTLAGNKDNRFNTWFDALEWMVEECKKIEFDVAIIGCGAYGFPLAAKIKEMGKIAIHLGGATQLMFGIKGSRWKNSREIDAIMNEFWTFPADSERIKNSEKVENSCYW